MGSQLSQPLALGKRGQRYLGFELSRVTTAGAFRGRNRAKLARFHCPTFGEYYSTDITCVPIAKEFRYLAAVLDWHARYVLS